MSTLMKYIHLAKYKKPFQITEANMLQWWHKTQKTSNGPKKASKYLSKDINRNQKTSKDVRRLQNTSKENNTHQKSLKAVKRHQKKSKDGKRRQKMSIHQNEEKHGHPNEVHTRRKVQKNIQINETNMLQRWHRRCLTS